jgi:hypothetical protein
MAEEKIRAINQTNSQSAARAKNQVCEYDAHVGFLHHAREVDQGGSQSPNISRLDDVDQARDDLRMGSGLQF